MREEVTASAAHALLSLRTRLAEWSRAPPLEAGLRHSAPILADFFNFFFFNTPACQENRSRNAAILERRKIFFFYVDFKTELKKGLFGSNRRLDRLALAQSEDAECQLEPEPRPGAGANEHVTHIHYSF